MERERRRQLGAWYTPEPLVDAVVAALLDGWEPPAGRAVRVVDPACGDGRFLAAVHRELTARGVRPHLVGVDIDADAVRVAAGRLGAGAELVTADALDLAAVPAGGFDLVVGNPPFLSPLAARNAAVAGRSPRGAPYADAAVQFLAAWWGRVADGGRLGFVLPQSVLANRDAAAARRAVTAAGALRWLWWSAEPVFDAAVRTCAVVAERGGPASPVARATGAGIEAAAPVRPAGERWSALVADLRGVPDTGPLETDGTVGDRAAATAGFRDEFYGLAAATSDEAAGPRLVTSGLVDPGAVLWGRRAVRLNRRRFDAPRVDLDLLPPGVRRWVARLLVPKVVVASQTRVIEAAADEHGDLVPGVPVIAVVPHPAARSAEPSADRSADPDARPSAGPFAESAVRSAGGLRGGGAALPEGGPCAAGGAVAAVWRLAAVLTSPVTSAWLAREAGGSGLSADAHRVTARTIEALPWPAGPLDDAAARLRAGDVDGCGTATLLAYGIDPARDGAADLLAWWRSRLPRSR